MLQFRFKSTRRIEDLEYELLELKDKNKRFSTRLSKLEQQCNCFHEETEIVSINVIYWYDTSPCFDEICKKCGKFIRRMTEEQKDIALLAKNKKEIEEIQARVTKREKELKADEKS